ncbi:MAG: pyridoxal-dependent decarboxylase, exosortase A system-associated [Novosphingobium sp. 28-62-57]|uniref:pyridoxal-dependent decarboxylase, exosortase A system-associated n=1 Tax=unclassified Novosphingobium TaxID=2644732 RepID=UPI000BC890AF|nr:MULTISPECIES: pyridoxal-dependent decarboxylase, exosortase A system-associated [unclassified Novosphingobium]OYW49831.1 MAG: pyridoxal-dependent decarboxylase, exosortase A system-associated [Novosphingobium sp. 12-62-10]OYZ12213.1 MAG: pyridoxal-dependent decarboxylase, exosortase A system-associated [Novosphingobium sp. 28-62-57]OZA40383.1 MAG: pyridoxal-dependent decarboxylase, exosortase A system-associated [Novosphingobium sp. 17-62-9]HQS68938.1 pyridoxal-dependent decarboxylase, exoso
MKPLGPIPLGFAAIDGVLAIDGRKVTDLVTEAGNTPLFVYSRAMLTAKAQALRAAMPQRLTIHYAIKANPYAPLLQHMLNLVDGFDIASGGELAIVQAAGIDPARVSFAGPGKRDAELEAAIAAGVTLNLESEGEASRALAIAEKLGVTPRLAIRVNPEFDLKGSGMKMGGGAKPFGIDEDRVPALGRRLIEAGADWRGFHIFAGSQALSADAIIETQRQTLALAARLADEIGAALPKCNLGGGFGIPYFPGDEPVDIVAVGAALEERFANLPDVLKDTAFCIELGRYLVGESGVYLATVVDRKESHGEVYLVTDGGLHHQLAASGNFGTVVRRNYPSAIATRFGASVEEEASIVGCLCTPLDRLADKGGFPRADAGDLVAIFCAGAYGATASPAAFLGQGPAREVLI